MKKPRSKKEVTPAHIQEFLSYDESTGGFIWLARDERHFDCSADATRWNIRYAGKSAFTTAGPGGYVMGSVFKNKLYAHRVAWAYVHGVWPLIDVDHINRNRSDNRIANLRLATRSENCRNGSVHRDNLVGLKGVTCNRYRSGIYKAHILVDGRRIALGNFDSAEGAHLAYVAAANQYFGEFASGGAK